MEDIQVMVVDDHQLMARGICDLVNSIPNFNVLAEARNGKELIQYIENFNNDFPDIILLDINMPIMNGFQTMEWMRKNHPEIPVLALTINDDEASVINMLRNGVKGYLLKTADADELVLAMNTILKKGFYSSEIANEKLVNSILKSNDKVVQNLALKARELEFLKFACTDDTYVQIADKMCLSPKTVDHYREVLFDKFGVKSRVGLVLFAIKNKLVNM